jgi:hypothetical protein
VKPADQAPPDPERPAAEITEEEWIAAGQACCGGGPDE